MKSFEKRLNAKLNQLPFEIGLDDGGYNDGQITGFELGAKWAIKIFIEKNNKIIDVYGAKYSLKKK